MAASTLTTVAYIFRRVYSEEAVADLARRDHPLFADISRQGGFTGSKFYYPIRYGNPQGISASFADAQSGASSSKGVQLELSRKLKYGVITLDGEAIVACDGNKGAFADLVRQETDGVIEELGDTMAFDLYRDGTGARGRRLSASSNVITLATSDDVRNFKVGMTIEADDTAAGTSPKTGTTTITALSRSGGTITVASAAAISGFANDDYLFRNGDAAACVEGLALLTPLTAPSSGESFRGIDRSADEELLAGVRINDTATTIEENLGLGAVKVHQNGQKQDRAYINPINFWQVARRQNAKVQYSDGGEAVYGFQYITIETPAGSLKLIADPDCPTNRAYGCRADAHYVKHQRGLPHIVMDDGLGSLREAANDGIEARARAFWNYAQRNPAAFSVIAI